MITFSILAAILIVLLGFFIYKYWDQGKGRILLIALIAFALLTPFLHLNLPYRADAIVCELDKPECAESDIQAVRASYDTMDGVYYIHKLYGLAGEIKLKDFCLVTRDTKLNNVCEDENGKKWFITLLETKI